MGRVSWDAYVKISEALDDQPGLRMIYCDGRLVFVGKSRRHDWFAERLGELVKAMARGLRNSMGGRGPGDVSTREQDAGLEGDKTFYFGEHAVLMRGPARYRLGCSTAAGPGDRSRGEPLGRRGDRCLGTTGSSRSLEVSAQDVASSRSVSEARGWLVFAVGTQPRVSRDYLQRMSWSS